MCEIMSYKASFAICKCHPRLVPRGSMKCICAAMVVIMFPISYCSHCKYDQLDPSIHALILWSNGQKPCFGWKCWRWTLGSFELSSIRLLPAASKKSFLNETIVFRVLILCIIFYHLFLRNSAYEWHPGIWGPLRMAKFCWQQLHLQAPSQTDTCGVNKNAIGNFEISQTIAGSIQVAARKFAVAAWPPRHAPRQRCHRFPTAPSKCNSWGASPRCKGGWTTVWTTLADDIQIWLHAQCHSPMGKQYLWV